MSAPQSSDPPALGHVDVVCPPRPSTPLRSAAEVVAGLDLPARVWVLVNDPARSTRSDEALAALGRATTVDGIVVATGSHEWGSQARSRHEAWLRSSLAGDVSIRWHDASGAGLAALDSGRRIDPWVAAAEAVVAVGSVEPHWFAGVTGAHKTLTIGILDRLSIERDHEAVLDGACKPLDLGGNRVHLAHRRLLHELHHDRRAIALQHVGAHWDGGDVFECLERLLPWARAAFVQQVSEPVDWVWSRVEGPLARSLYQADKGLKNVEGAVRDGGAIVLEADLVGGIGPDRFVQLLESAEDAAGARCQVDRHGYRLGDHKAVRWRALQDRGVRIGLLGTMLPEALLQTLGVVALPDADSAWSWLRATLGAHSTGVVVPDAGNTVLEVR